MAIDTAPQAILVPPTNAPRLRRPQSVGAIFAGLIDPTVVTYRGVTMRSALEADFARNLDDQEIPWRYEPAIYHGYLPDFEVVDAHPPLFIEVKPTLREVPGAKRRMAAIWRSVPTALLVVACAEQSRYFGALKGRRWTSWIERWAHS
jgi:hypothetical protein